jgi:hypothetical protein
MLFMLLVVSPVFDIGVPDLDVGGKRLRACLKNTYKRVASKLW